MMLRIPSRLHLPFAAALCVAGVLGVTCRAQRNAQPPAAVERRSPPAAPAQAPQAGLPRGRANMGAGGKLQGEHLAAWLDKHRTETTPQKLQSLEKEPGFHDLPPATQQRMRDRLIKLESMPPQQRQKAIDRAEAFEKLTPDQRVQVRSTLQQVAALPLASRRAVQRTFRIVREMPVEQRAAYLSSPDIRSQFTDQERTVLDRLMAVEPYIPPLPGQKQQP